jgi:hypothetical protein
VAGDVMLPVVLRLHAYMELRMELLQAMRANPRDAGLRAQFNQVAHDVVVTMAELQALEAQWGFCARSPMLPARSLVCLGLICANMFEICNRL